MTIDVTKHKISCEKCALSALTFTISFQIPIIIIKTIQGKYFNTSNTIE